MPLGREDEVIQWGRMHQEMGFGIGSGGGKVSLILLFEFQREPLVGHRAFWFYHLAVAALSHDMTPRGTRSMHCTEAHQN